MITRTTRACASYLAALPSTRAIETRSPPSSLAATHRGFAFYVAFSKRSIRQSRRVLCRSHPCGSIRCGGQTTWRSPTVRKTWLTSFCDNPLIFLERPHVELPLAPPDMQTVCEHCVSTLVESLAPWTDQNNRAHLHLDRTSPRDSRLSFSYPATFSYVSISAGVAFRTLIIRIRAPR